MKANTAASKKAKGSRLENKVASTLRSTGADKDARRMPMSGAIAHFKSDIYAPNIPWSIECKNTEKVKLWEFWEQARSQAGMKKPALVVSGNFRPELVVVQLEDWANLIAENNQLWERINNT